MHPQPMTPSSVAKEPTEGRWAIFRRDCHGIFYLNLALFIISLALSCSILGICASSHQNYQRRYNVAKASSALPAVVSAMSTEVMWLSTGKLCAEVCADLNDRLDELEKVSTQFGIDIAQVRNYVSSGRAGYASDSGTHVSAFAFYNQAALIIATSLRRSFYEQTDVGYAVEMGVLCVTEQVVPLFNSFTLQYQPVLAEWDTEQYVTYQGSVFGQASLPDCSLYHSAMNDFNATFLRQQGPTLSSEPELDVASVAALDTDAFQEVMQSLSTQLVAQSKQQEKYWATRRNRQSTFIVLSCISVLMFISFLLAMPYFIPANMTRSGELVKRRYQSIEEKANVIPRLAVYISTLKENRRLPSFLQNGLLTMFEGFVERVRPFIPQTCFGDVESVGFTDSGEVAQPREDAAAGLEALGTEDEHRSQELRGEVGLQLACGTFMCVAAASHILHSDNEAGEERQRALTERMRSLVSAVERVTNSRRGVVHTITGDYIFATWNIVGACAGSEVSAFLTALELANIFRDRLGGISISLSSSPAVAGNFDANGQRTSVMLGPAQARCEKLELLNHYTGTLIMLDETVARRVSLAPLPTQEFCVVPAALFRCCVGLERKPFEVAFGVFPSRLQGYHRAWAKLFQTFLSMLQANRVNEMLESVKSFKEKYVKPAAKRKDGRPADPQVINIAKTVDFWILFLSSIKNDNTFHEGSM